MTLPTPRITRTRALALIIVGCMGSGWAFAGLGTWTSSGPTGQVSALATDPVAPSVVYAGTFSGSQRNVYKTVDGGRSWIATGLSQSVTSALAVGPSGTVYAGGFESADFKSDDGGATWSQMRPVHSGLAVLFFRIDPQMPTTLYAGTASTATVMGDSGGELLRSSDAGQTWVNLQNIQNGLDFGTVGDLVIDPQNTATLYTVIPRGFYKSVDAGLHWSKLENGLPTPILTTLEIDPAASNVIYAGNGSGVFKSSDSGNTFSRVGAGLPASGVWDLLINPRRPSSLYAATRDAGVYASEDGGATWTALNSGLTNLSVFELAIDPSGTFLHVATTSGVFDYQLSTSDTILTLSQSHRFVVQLTGRDSRGGRTSGGLAMPLGDLAGYFSIPELTGSPQTPEVFVKVVDGRTLNGAFWFFHGALTDLEYTLTVTEEATGRVKTYSKAAGSACGGFDTSAFPSP